jgi:parafibromin
VLEGAASYFDRVQRERGNMCVSTPAIHTPTSPASLDARPRRMFGLAPWHRKNSNESMLSVSSSVHQLLMGRTPAATPNPERKYAGHEGKTYPRGNKIRMIEEL